MKRYRPRQIHALGDLDESAGHEALQKPGALLSTLVAKQPAHTQVQRPKFGVPHLAVGIWVATAFVLLAGPKKAGARDLTAAYGVVMPLFGLVG